MDASFVSNPRVTAASFIGTPPYHPRLDGLDALHSDFVRVIADFKRRGYDPLDMNDRAFETDYLDMNVRVSEIETRLQGFVNHSFEVSPSIIESLKLLRKFQTVLLVRVKQCNPSLPPKQDVEFFYSLALCFYIAVLSSCCSQLPLCLRVCVHVCAAPIVAISTGEQAGAHL